MFYRFYKFIHIGYRNIGKKSYRCNSTFSAKVPAYATAKILAIDTEALAGVNTSHLRGECKFLASKTDALVTLQMSCTVPTVVS